MSEELSYDDLVEHIVLNKPIPNVVQVPDTVLDSKLGSQPRLTQRIKPWEQVEVAGEETPTNDNFGLVNLSTNSDLSKDMDNLSKLALRFGSRLHSYFAEKGANR